MTTEQDIQLKKEIEHIFESGANEYRIYEMFKNFFYKINKNPNTLLLTELIKNLQERKDHLTSLEINKKNDLEEYIENQARIHELLLIQIHLQKELLNNLNL
jgi:hypothetical protein